MRREKVRTDSLWFKAGAESVGYGMGGVGIERVLSRQDVNAVHPYGCK